MSKSFLSRFSPSGLMGRLASPSTLLVLVANLIPLVGVSYWGWDAFLLLMLFWMETAVIAFWTIMRIRHLPPEVLSEIEVNGKKGGASGFWMAAFFTLHAGLFMLVHFVFLWALFSDTWSRAVSGPVSFVREIVIAPGLWIPLLLMFLGGAISFVLSVFRPAALEPLRRALNPRVDAAAPASEGDPVMTLIGSLYGRIVIMQLAIILGAFVAGFLGSMAPLVLIVVLKTLAELGLHPFELAPGKAAAAPVQGTRKPAA